ncbi:MAG: cell wall-binding protein, partial [Hungatella sp.]
MKKKSLFVLAMTVLLTLGIGTSTAFAAAGWTLSNGKWFYYGTNGEMATNEWKRGADDQWRYLNGSGEMAINAWAEGEYYVDSNGIMVVDKWAKLRNSMNGETEGERWYYFNNSGKAAIDIWKKIDDKWYHFNDSGSMETGWVDDNLYYCGEDGAAKIGWCKLDPPEGDIEKDDFAFAEDDGKRWFYFSPSGKKYIPDAANGAEYGERRIDSTYYCFDSNGVMQTGWVYLGADGADHTAITDYRFYGPDGKVRTGWYSAEPPKDKTGYENEVEWFYFSKNGVPKASPTERLHAGDMMLINKKRYLFNSLGTPVYGLQKVYSSVNSEEYTAYYFGSGRSDCTAKVGRMKLEEGDGSSGEYYFTESGKGFTGVKDNGLYYMGKLQKAAEGLRYQVISLPTGNTHNNYLVNAGGKLVKSTTGVKDADGTKYSSNHAGIVQKINDVAVGNEKFAEPLEPIWY